MSELERGRRLLVAAAVMMVSMAVTFHCGVAEAKTYTIQWHENPDLSSLLVPLYAGDTIVLSYKNRTDYNAIKVDYDRYIKCIGVGEDVYHSGNDSFTVTKKENYFICGANNHCQNDGMKFAVYGN